MRLAIWAVATCLCLIIGTNWMTKRELTRAEQAYPPVGEFVEVEGHQVHYIDEGSGPAVILIHGASGNLRDWTFSMSGRLAARYRVLAFDRAGHGYSDRPADGYDPAVQGRLIAKAARKLGVEKAILVGHSFGCAPALAIALDDPDLAAGLVDVAGASHPWDGSLSIRYPLSFNPLTSWALRMIAGMISEEKLVDPVFEPQATPDGYVDHIGVALALRPTTFRHNAEDILRLNESLKRMAPRYPSLKLPVEILHGSLDDVVTESISPRGVERDVPHARFTLLDGSGHMPHHVAEDEIVAAIDRLAIEAFGETTK